jgi:group I intron endonuclease
MGCLYKLTSPSGKSYIGVSCKGLEARWAKHVEHALGKRSAGVLYAALRKYGPETFAREVLAEHDDFDALRAMETAAIREHATLAPNGYNITHGGEGTRNRLSALARENISVAQKKRFQNPVERQRLLAWSKLGSDLVAARAKPIREEKRAARRRYVQSAEFKELHSQATRAGMATPDARKAVLDCARARAANPEWRRKVGDSKRGKKLGPCSQERKRKISEARRREWSDPVIRARRLEAFAKARQQKGAS